MSRRQGARGAESTREAAAEPSRLPAGSASSATRSPASLDVAGEAALLRRAKAAVERQAWRRASRQLDAYEARYSEGVLRPEARALRRVVDCGQDSPGAADRARAFLRAHGESPLKQRIRGACDLPSAP